MAWWEYLKVWEFAGVWRQERQERLAQEAKFKELLHEAETRRGDLQTAVVELREDRERRQAASMRRPMISIPQE